MFSYVAIAGGYSTTSQSFMLLRTREIGYLMMSLFYIAHIRKKTYIWAPGPPVSDNFIIFTPLTIAGGYSTTFQSFMLLPTREVGELVLIQIYIAHIRKNTGLGPGPPKSGNYKFFFTNYRHTSVLSKFPKFHASTFIIV